MRRLIQPLHATAALLAIVTAIAVAPARAEDATEGVYRDLIRRALAAFDKKDWSSAQALFASAHALEPSARTLRGLGMVAFEMQDYVRAHDVLGAALEDPRKPLEGALRAETLALRARTRALIARVRFTDAPPGAELTLDGEPAELDRTNALWMMPGTHRLRIVAPGHAPEQFELTTNAGDDIAYEVRLERSSLVQRPLPRPSATEAAARPEAEHARALDASLAGAAAARDDAELALTDRWWFWAGAGAIAISAGVALALLASADEDEEPLVRGTDGVVITTLSLP